MTEPSVASRIDAYIDAAPAAMQAHLGRMRREIAAAAPDAIEAFAYGIPGFKYLGRPLAYYGAAAKHYALYGHSDAVHEALSQDLKGLDMSKGTIRFPPSGPFPEALVRKIVEVRLAEIRTTEVARRAKRRARSQSKS